MSATAMTEGRAHAIGWVGSLLLMGLLYTLLGLLTIDRPRRAEPPPAAALTWVRQVYKAPTRVERVRQSLRVRAMREVPDLRLRPEDVAPRQPQRTRPERAGSAIERPVDRSPLVDAGERGVDRQSPALGLPARRGGDRSRAAVDLPTFENERPEIRQDPAASAAALGSARNRLMAWASVQARREPGADLAAFGGCAGALPAGRMAFGARVWQAWLCGSGDGPLRLLLVDGSDAALLVLAGEDLELQSLKLADRIDGGSGGLVARYAGGDEGGLRAALLQYLEELR